MVVALESTATRAINATLSIKVGRMRNFENDPYMTMHWLMSAWVWAVVFGLALYYHLWA
jgi:hypothetical protein